MNPNASHDPSVEQATSAPEQLLADSGNAVAANCCGAFWKRGAIAGSLFTGVLAIVAGFAFYVGQASHPASDDVNLPWAKAATSHGGKSMAMATGMVSQDAEGVFFLDYTTGDLQCWVYYPRNRAFGAKFGINVTGQLPPSGKNPQYLLTTGEIIGGGGTGNARPGGSLVYVVDENSGMFAAYAVPWNRTAESGSMAQMGALVPVGGGIVKAPNMRP